MRKRGSRHRIRTLLDLPYVKLPIIIIVLGLSGLTVFDLLLLIGSVYVLATLVGFPTLQLGHRNAFRKRNVGINVRCIPTLSKYNEGSRSDVST